MSCDDWRRFLSIKTALLSMALLDLVAGQFYTSRYDALDIDDVLNHKRLVHHYTACLLNRGPCPPQGTDLKQILPEALESNCARCTEKQKYIARSTITRLKNEYPSLFNELSDLYDPTGALVARFEASFSDSANSVVPLTADRFGDSENNIAGNFNNEISPPATSTTAKPTSSSTTTTTTTTSTQKTVVFSPKIKKGGTETFKESTQSQITASTSAPNIVIPTILDGKMPLLGSIAQLGSQVLRAGTQVAEMFLSTVQAFIGP